MSTNFVWRVHIVEQLPSGQMLVTPARFISADNLSDRSTSPGAIRMAAYREAHPEYVARERELARRRMRVARLGGEEWR